MVEDKVSSSLQEGSLLQLQTTPQGDGGASLRKEAEDQDTPLQHVQSQTVMQTDETSKPVESRGVTALSPKPSTSKRDLSEKEVSSRDLEKTRSSQSKEKEKQTVGKTAHVDSTSGSVADSKGGRLASVSLLKDSGIGDPLNVTSVTETSPQAAPMVSLRRKSSDPYTFHGSQSQQMTTEQPTTSRVGSTCCTAQDIDVNFMVFVQFLDQSCVVLKIIMISHFIYRNLYQQPHYHQGKNLEEG